MKQLKKVSIRWTPSLAYCVGIIATDGNLSPDARHIVITSKDKQILNDIRDFFCLNSKIGTKSNGVSGEKKYYVLQIGDTHFYHYLLSIGLTPKKSKSINELFLPNKYFNHFLRGCIDGDGNFDIYRHKESLYPQLRIRLASASKPFLLWIDKEIKKNLLLQGGWIYSQKQKSWHVLTYGKKDSCLLIKYLYKKKTLYLHRKFKKVESFLK